ncbi:MAG: glutamate--tRNA ligase [Candidatus Levybacteria bacterium]|nr:glutamate--tRNA ligase [Candidatus Levybacteria bacterium]
MVRVRFAPSPTGIPHVGNIRTALFNYFFAKKEGGKFILRIEDTDQARKVAGAQDAIKQSLSWLGISWDEYIVQSEHLDDYKKYAKELVSKGLAKEEDGAVVFITPREGETSWVDKIGNKAIEFENKDIEDFIILKSDGFPTYHLANVVDDNKEGVTHVIRGEDWVSSTPKHILLYKAFGWNIPQFVHVPNILGPDKSKLSKRRGAKSVLDFKKEGFLPEALLNYLMLLGWSPKNDREILSKEEITKEFSLENINVSPAVFDQKKLEWMNGEYIRKLSVSDLKSKIKNQKSKIQFKNEKVLDELILLAQTRMKTLLDFKTLVGPLIQGSKVDLSTEEKKVAEKLKERLSAIEQWSSEAILTALKEIMESEGVKMQTVYKIFTGNESGLPLPQSLEILGKEKTLKLLVQ